MRVLATATRLAFVATQTCRLPLLQQHSHQAIPAAMNSFYHDNRAAVGSVMQQHRVQSARNGGSTTRLFSGDGGGQQMQLQNIGKDEMEEIIEDYETGGREESGYVVLDVREENEIAQTGKLSPNTLTLPLQKLMQVNAFALDEDEFEDTFGFEKPALDETLVFSCAAGVRSVHAAQFAAMNGYSKLVNYQGGANEWFF